MSTCPQAHNLLLHELATPDVDVCLHAEFNEYHFVVMMQYSGEVFEWDVFDIALASSHWTQLEAICADIPKLLDFIADVRSVQ